jgi:hypothetical protein
MIDYVACSKDVFYNIAALTIRDLVKGYDHAATVLTIKLDFDVQSTELASPSQKRKIERILPSETDLNGLFISTLEAGKNEAKKLQKLYGPVTSTTPTLKFTVHGTSVNAGKITAAAAAATYWGPNARLNSTSRVCRFQTGPRGELLAEILALENAPSYKSLEISTKSEYAIGSAAYYAARNEACGRRCQWRPHESPNYFPTGMGGVPKIEIENWRTYRSW